MHSASAVPGRTVLRYLCQPMVDSERMFPSLSLNQAALSLPSAKVITPSTVTDIDGQPVLIPNAVTMPTSARVAIAPTFGLGFTFYANRWMAFGFEWRATPFGRNTGGFDNHGGGLDNDFPDQAIDGDDRDLKLNQMLTVSWNIYMPFDYRVSE